MARLLLLGVALCAALLFPSLLPDLFRPVNHALNDWRLRFSMHPHPESRIVIVDVDERSLAAHGAWPWSRDTMARLIQALIDDYGVASIAVDMVFPEQRPNDHLLATQLQRPPVTGAIVYDLEARNLPPSTLPLPPTLPVQLAPDAPTAAGVVAVTNHGALMPGRAGHITPIFDSDGAVRRLPPLVCAVQECRPSLALTTYAGITESSHLKVQRGQGLLAPAWELILQAGAVPVATVPLESDGTLVVPYRHAKRDWTAVSAVDVLHGKVDPAALKGVMVLVGATALGLSDVIATPLSPVAAGLEPHAEVLSALLDNDFLIVPQWGIALDAILLFPCALILAWMGRRLDKPLQRALIFPAWLVFTWMASAVLALSFLRMANVLLPLAPLLLFPPLAVLLILSAELYRAGRDRTGIFMLLSAYLPRQVAQRLVATGYIQPAVDATRREITVLFADIHGFAGLSEGRSPEIVARLMQRVFTEMAEAVVIHHGTIDKFIGDAIMAFWNAPEDDPLHAQRAIAAAKDMQQRMAALAPFCIALGVPPIQIGIGIESGHALVGNFGSTHRRTFTALGEPVILASRLEGLTKVHKKTILIGETCAASVGVETLQALGSVPIRGRVQPLMLYSPH